jgi:hypothetical protein
MSYNNRSPFSDVVAKSKVIVSGNTDTLITRVPWQPGANKYYNLRKIHISTQGALAATGTTVVLWDKDLSSATPATRGNASTGALLTLSTLSGVSGYGTNIMSSSESTPRIRFEAGVTAQATSPNTSIVLELELH